MNKVLKSTKYVTDNASFITINKNAVQNFVNNFEHDHIRHWLKEAPFDLTKLSKNDSLNFLLVFNAISFSYWGDPKWSFEYKGKTIDGAWGMIAALGRAIDEGFHILDFSYLASISEEDLRHILRGNIEIPLFQDRLKILRETGEIIVNKYEGSFSNLIQQSKDVNELRDLLVKTFSSFEDVGEYKEQKVFFYKRVQLLLSDIHQMFKGKGLGNFTNVEELTACADYKLPQILRKLGVLEYSEYLAKKIDKQEELSAGGNEEIEIRSGVIWAVEYIKQGLDIKGVNATSMDVNDHLWLLTQTKYQDDKPYHLVRTISY